MKPIAWINEYDGLEPFNPDNRQEWIPLYTHPIKEFTDDEIAKIALENYDGKSALVDKDLPWHYTIVSFARALLKKAQE